MLPKPMHDLTGEDAKRFLEADKMPLSKEEKESLDRCIHVFRNIKPRRK